MSITARIPKKWRRPFIAVGLFIWVGFVSITTYKIFYEPDSSSLLSPLAFLMERLFVLGMCLYTLWLISEALKDWDKQ